MANLLVSGRPLWKKRREQRKTKKMGASVACLHRNVRLKLVLFREEGGKGEDASESAECKQRIKAGARRGAGGVYITGMSHFLRWRSAVCAHNVHRAIRASGMFFPSPCRISCLKHILSHMQPIPRGLLRCLKRILGQN